MNNFLIIKLHIFSIDYIMDNNGDTAARIGARNRAEAVDAAPKEPVFLSISIMTPA